MEKPSDGASVRVVVRVRPPDKPQAICDALRIGPDGKRVTITHAPAAEDEGGGIPRQRNVTSKSYAFDAVLSPHASQTDIYETAGIQGLVEAASQGFHSTILAYGQTGSGKTYTMEGFKYVPRAHGPPVADFDGTPSEKLGVVPRAVHALFDSLKSNPDRRSLIKCSFVQIYKEQAYDLLNPATIAAATQGPKPSPQQLRGSPGLPGAVAGALRMRWSKQDDFYLENLFKVEVASPDEALALFRGGVLNKVMASHKLNASSSRSHCLFTLYIDSHPMSSPSEIISSRLTLVDLAGSERAAIVGATEGKLRDENVAINKSLFTLRQVITALAASNSSASDGNEKPPSRQQSRSQSQRNMPPPQSQLTHVPYRDSKLTSLLKNSLGGNSLTLMIACLAPSDDYIEENISTLDYASRAARITNKVALNEDPKTRIIRELREEVAFLRHQLMMAGTGGGGGGSSEASSSLLTPAPLKTSPLAITVPNQAPPDSSDLNSGGPLQGEATSSQTLTVVSAESDEMREKLLESSQHDIGVIVGKCLQFYSLVQQLTTTNQQLRRAYGTASQGSEQLRIDNDSLMLENAGLRDRLSFIEGMAGMPETTPQAPGCKRTSMGMNSGASSSLDHPPSSSGSVMNPSNVFTPGAAALIELQELRRENQLLRDRLKMSLDDRPDFDVLSHGNTSPTKFRGKNSIQSGSGGKVPAQRGSRGTPQPVATSNPFTPVALRNMSTTSIAGGGGGTGMSVASLRDMLASSSSQAPVSSEAETASEASSLPGVSHGSLSSMTLPTFQPWAGSGVLSSHQDDSGAMQKLTVLMSQRNALARARIVGGPSPETNTTPPAAESPKL